jgi:LysM repeat protein
MQNVRIMSTHPSQPRTEKRQPQPNRATILVGLGALFIVLPLILLSTTVVLFQVCQMNLPGVIVYDKEVGLMSREETLQLIDSYWNENRQIQLVSSQNPEDAYWLTPAELGYWVDPEATARTAFDLGRDADPFSDIISAASGEAQVVMPVLYFNENTARQTLSAIAKDLSLPAEEASITTQDSAWVALPGKAGRTVDIEATLDDLRQNAFAILQSQSVTLYIQPTEPEIDDLTPILSDIESALVHELRFRAYDPITNEDIAWTVPMDVKQSWVSVDPDTFEVTLSPDNQSVQDLLNSWEENLGKGRSWENPPDPETLIQKWANSKTITAIIQHNPTTYQVSPGESLWSISLKLGMPMWHIMDANDGLTVSNLEAGMILTIPSKNILLPLPVILDKRILIDISEQRMTVYENTEIRSTHIVSTGMSDSPTMAGVFQVQTHELNAYASNWDLYMPHFMGIYEAWPGFMNGIHGLPLLSSGQRLWASALGSPASYGCIIMDLTSAEDLYYWAEDGVVVEITN